MSLNINPDLEYGLVLEGGGARGAYQIGVWKALREMNIKIKGVVGTSVGALNGALICMDSFDEALYLWENISYSQVMDVKDDMVENLKLYHLNALDLSDVFDGFKKFVLDGGVAITPLKNLIKDLLDEEKIRQCDKEFGLVTVSLSDFKSVEKFIEDIPKGELMDYLIASAYFPLFKREKINGKKYIDGGFSNNLPINLLINKGYKNILVVRVFGIGVEPNIKIEEDINVTEIAPQEDLGGLLDFRKEICQYNIKLGYYDALRSLRGLDGKKYYINRRIGDDEYIQKLLNLSETLQNDFLEMYKIDLPYRRGLFEIILPKVAKKLKMNSQWNYSQLFIGLLEFAAIKFKIEKFRIYTDQELLENLQDKIRLYETKKGELSHDRLIDLLIRMIKEL